ncbi:MAG TPA: UvrD-helicase domain-containing protein [Bryobacteraceae bacterium]|nr:UvrD-helicase domain-containing protein [Bryobacteraceae bacterium]
MIPAGAAAVADLKQSYIVEASAGTGKTTALVHRIVDVIATGAADIEKIVAVTFTHHAAGNMKLRVRGELERRRARELDNSVRSRLADAAQKLDKAFIGTIHAFCAQLLRQRPIEAGIDPRFRELSQSEALLVFGRVFRCWIEAQLAAPSATLQRALARLAWRDESGQGEPLDSLRQAAWCLAEWRDYNEPWSARPFDRDRRLNALLEEAETVAALRSQCVNVYDPLFSGLQPLADFLDRVRRASEVGVRDSNVIENELLRLPVDMRWLKIGYGRFAQNVTRETILDRWNAFKAQIEAFRLNANADLVASLRNELWQVVAMYEEAKSRAGLLDFMDLLLYARRLLYENEGARRNLQARYTHIFVDEFQDTDPLQADILLLLAAQDPAAQDWRQCPSEPGKLYLVGDPKQSIFRFRRADAELYRRICEQLGIVGVVQDQLNTSSRSTEALQAFVNAAFEKMPEYLPLEGGAPAHPDQPAVLALPMPNPYGARNLSKAAVDQCSPNAVAAFIHWLLQESKWKVRDRKTGEWVRLKEGDICILFRRFSNRGVDLTQHYVRSLEARGIRHVLVGSKSFHQREEIGTLRTALCAIEWPEDELSVFALLKGTLFAVLDDTLLRFRSTYGRFYPFTKLPPDLDPEFHPIRDAFDLIKDLHRTRNAVPIADTLNQLLESTRAQAAFAFRAGGERVLANVYRLADLARSFEVGGSATSFRAFVEFLETEYQTSGTSEAPVLEQQGDGVQIRTVHKAKGLEFPVVILADLTANLISSEGGDRYIKDKLCAQRLLGWTPWELLDHSAEEREAEREEGMRLAYVAATRARDLLVIAGVGAKQYQGDDSWLSPLYDALYPPDDRWQVAGAARGCPKFGDSTVLNVPFDQSNSVCIRPGRHFPKIGSHEVVWFDPKLLKLEVPKREGVEDENVLSGTDEQASAGLETYNRWKARREEFIAAGCMPAFNLRTAHNIRQATEAAHIEITYMDLRSGPARSSNRKVGTVVHEILQNAAGSDECAALAQVYGRKHGVAPMEIAAAAETARKAFLHLDPILSNAAEIHRELPVIVRLEDGTIVEGNVDLAAFDGKCWTVVDYKTGRADDPDPVQLQIYGLALQRATGSNARGIFLEV